MDTQDEHDKGICIVSFDGGGPGSISQLLFIKEVLRRIEFHLDLDEDTIRPVDHWDLMGGVGFGGLCALMLGCLGMSVLDAQDELARIGNTVFPQAVSEFATSEGNLTILKEAIEAMLRRRKFPVDTKLNDQALSASRCKVVVFASTASNADHCYPFRAYSSRYSNLSCTFVEAACATLATPQYFSPVAIGPESARRRFIGPPLGFNNPTRQVLEEARSKFGNERKVSLILSLGSGRPAALSLPRPDSLHVLYSRVVHDCERVDRELSDQLFHLKAYLRLHVDQGMRNIRISDWKGLGSIAEHTDVYLHRPDIDDQIEICSRFLRERNSSISLGRLTRNIIPMEDQVITLVDAIGNHIPIALALCRTYEMLVDLVCLYFKHQKPPGIAYVERGDYRLVHGGLGSIIKPTNWPEYSKPGLRIEMSMVLRKRGKGGAKCPLCGTRSDGNVQKGWVDWKYGFKLNPNVRGRRSQSHREGNTARGVAGLRQDREGESGDDGRRQFRLISVIILLDPPDLPKVASNSTLLTNGPAAGPIVRPSIPPSDSQLLNQLLQSKHFKNYSWTPLVQADNTGKKWHKASFGYAGAVIPTTSPNWHPNAAAAREEAVYYVLPVIRAAFRELT